MIVVDTNLLVHLYVPGELTLRQKKSCGASRFGFPCRYGDQNFATRSAALSARER